MLAKYAKEIPSKQIMKLFLSWFAIQDPNWIKSGDNFDVYYVTEHD